MLHAIVLDEDAQGSAADEIGGQPDLSNQFIAHIAQVLNEAQIPCVLWGHCLYRVHGIPSIIGVRNLRNPLLIYNAANLSQSIDFVVPDHELHNASLALSRIECLQYCPDEEGCSVISSDRPTQPPSLHLHIKNAEEPVSLFAQSETLSFLPPLDASSLLPSHSGHLPSEYIFASDETALPPWRPGRGPGVFDAGLGPVVVLRPHIFLEASLRIHARDFGQPHGDFSMTPISYIQLYVDADGLLDVTRVSGSFATLYDQLKEDNTSLREWTRGLQRALDEEQSRTYK